MSRRSQLIFLPAVVEKADLGMVHWACSSEVKRGVPVNVPVGDRIVEMLAMLAPDYILVVEAMVQRVLMVSFLVQFEVVWL